jgi:hypothetical protein
MPAYLEDETAHNALVNSKTLELAGITKDTPDPKGGEIARYENGEPTGYLVEMGATGLVKAVLPPPTLEVRADGLAWACGLANSNGIAMIGDAQTFEDYLPSKTEELCYLE